MATVYSVPDSIKVPELNFRDIEAYREACNKFTADLKEWCVQRAANVGVTDENYGKIIRFPVADGYAEYMVACLKPIQLIHLPLWDAWEFQYANRLTKKDIIEKIQQQNSLEKLFGGMVK